MGGFQEISLLHDAEWLICPQYFYVYRYSINMCVNPVKLSLGLSCIKPRRSIKKGAIGSEKSELASEYKWANCID